MEWNNSIIQPITRQDGYRATWASIIKYFKLKITRQIVDCCIWEWAYVIDLKAWMNILAKQDGVLAFVKSVNYTFSWSGDLRMHKLWDLAFGIVYRLKSGCQCRRCRQKDVVVVVVSLEAICLSSAVTTSRAAFIVQLSNSKYIIFLLYKRAKLGRCTDLPVTFKILNLVVRA